MSHARVVLAVTGSIAAYKAAELLRLLTKSGVSVECILTRSATEFIAPLTFATLSGRPVTVELFGAPAGAAATYGDAATGTESLDGGWAEAPGGGPTSPAGASPRNASPAHVGETQKISGAPSSVEHIRATRGADLIVVAPATANVLAKVAQGIADDALSTTLLASSAPVLFAPAMNTLMWNHPAVQANVSILRSWGYLFADPGEGDLACGEHGAGRMAEPAEIAGQILRFLAVRSGRPALLVTAGGTEEPIDPVRVVANRSSGRMGFAVAEAGRDAGLPVTVIAGRTSVPPPHGVHLVRVESAAEMKDAVVARHRDHPLLVMTAAVADYRPARPAARKLRSGEAGLHLDLLPTVDILRTVTAARRDLVTVGFALETGGSDSSRHAAAAEKLARKGVDLLVLNDPTQAGSEFGGAYNQAVLLTPGGSPEPLPNMEKTALGKEIVRRALALWASRSAGSADPAAPSAMPATKAGPARPAAARTPRADAPARSRKRSPKGSAPPRPSGRKR